MSKCACGKELTSQEEHEYGGICMQCFLIAAKKKCLSIGVSTDMFDEPAENFGRTDEEKAEFKKYIEEHVDFTDVQTTRKASSSEDATAKFKEQVNKTVGSAVFNTEHTSIKIPVTGVSEDVKLTLELPNTYPVRPEYYKEAEQMLQACLEIIVNYLAFAPLTNTTIEQQLIEKFGLTKKNNEGPY